jgi:RNA-directed DNA polymerase
MVGCVMASTTPALRGPRPLARMDATCAGTGRSTGWPLPRMATVRIGKGGARNPMMNIQGKSDSPIVPVKSPNNAARAVAEATEGRGGAKENAVRGSTRQTQRWESVSLALDRIRQAAQRDRKTRFTALYHHVSLDLLRWSFHQLKRQAAAGVDGITWEQYGAALESNLADLHERVQRGAFRAKPSRRQYIPKPDGRRRPIGIASLEDKIVQRAVVAILNAIYEVDFLGFSYGFRPGRSQHQALDALAVGIYRRRVSWVLDADIRAFFDSISHAWLMRFLEHRIGDRRLLRLIGKWLWAGVLDEGRLVTSEWGTPQGAVISPVLANVYLHYALDLWTQRWRKRHATGHVIVVRYADDVVLGFQHLAEAQGFLADLKERLGAFALELHPAKTRIIEFGRFAAPNRAARGLGRPETFAFLGFTHICGKSRQGGFIIRRHTIRDRLRGKLHEVKDTLYRMRHLPIDEQGRYLGRVVNGYLNYFAVPTNNRAINSFCHHAIWYWLKALQRRSQARRMNWRRMRPLIARWVPPARLRHPLPEVRFDVRIRGGSPVR